MENKRMSYQEMMKWTNITGTIKKWGRRGVLKFKETATLLQMISGDEEMRNMVEVIINAKKNRKNDKREQEKKTNVSG